MGTLILTGPPAAGKSVVAQALAALRPKACVVEAELVRRMVVRPDATAWQPGVRAAASAASSFAADGFDVVLVDALTEESTQLYLSLLGERTRIAQLLPEYEEVLRRHRLRGPEAGVDEDGRAATSEAEVERLYREQAALANIDARFDNTALSPEEVADALSAWL